MSAKDIVHSILHKDLKTARKQIQHELNTRSYQAIQDMKPEVMRDAFKVQEEVESLDEKTVMVTVPSIDRKRAEKAIKEVGIPYEVGVGEGTNTIFEVNISDDQDLSDIRTALKDSKVRAKISESVEEELTNEEFTDEAIDEFVENSEDYGFTLEELEEADLEEGLAKAIGKGIKKAAKRMSTSGRADAAEKKADRKEKKAGDKERLAKAKDRIKATKKKK